MFNEPVICSSPTTLRVLPSNVKLASPFKALAPVNVAILLFTPFASDGIVVEENALVPTVLNTTPSPLSKNKPLVLSVASSNTLSSLNESLLPSPCNLNCLILSL